VIATYGSLFKVKSTAGAMDKFINDMRKVNFPDLA
jgi:hypothetical protein